MNRRDFILSGATLVAVSSLPAAMETHGFTITERPDLVISESWWEQGKPCWEAAIKRDGHEWTVLLDEYPTSEGLAWLRAHADRSHARYLGDMA